MELGSTLSLLIDGGFAGVVLGLFMWLIIMGHLVTGKSYEEKQKECNELKSALTAERARGDAYVAAAMATRDVLRTLQEVRHVSAPQKDE